MLTFSSTLRESESFFICRRTTTTTKHLLLTFAIHVTNQPTAAVRHQTFDITAATIQHMFILSLSPSSSFTSLFCFFAHLLLRYYTHVIYTMNAHVHARHAAGSDEQTTWRNGRVSTSKADKSIIFISTPFSSGV